MSAFVIQANRKFTGKKTGKRIIMISYLHEDSASVVFTGRIEEARKFKTRMKAEKHRVKYGLQNTKTSFYRSIPVES